MLARYLRDSALRTLRHFAALLLLGVAATAAAQPLPGKFDPARDADE